MEQYRKDGYEPQILTDPEIQQDMVYVLGDDGELHEMEVAADAGDD